MATYDLTGQTFGYLRVIRQAPFKDPKYNKFTMWECECDCGNPETLYVSTTDLRQGRKTSCGCARRRNKLRPHNFIDLSNQVFGKLTVLYPIENTSPVQWQCKCECGNEIVRSGRSLREGKTLSCGCNIRDLRSNLIGQRFGRLTVVDRADNYVSPKGQTQVMYQCLCDCGNLKVIAASSLRQGATQSCGCLRSGGEEIVENILKELAIPYQREYRIEDCKDKRPLPFDFALFNKQNELILLIEINGKQHYEPRFGKTLEESINLLEYTKLHDETKIQYCQNNNIPLLVIPYYKINTAKTIIIERLKTL